MKTTAEPSPPGLKGDRSVLAADGSDLAFVTVAIEDSAGSMVPRSTNLVEFELEGPGELVAVDSGFGCRPKTQSPLTKQWLQNFKFLFHACGFRHAKYLAHLNPNPPFISSRLLIVDNAVQPVT